MDWDVKDRIEKGEYIGKVLAFSSIIYTFVIFLLAEIYEKFYLSTSSFLVWLTFPTGYTLFFLQEKIGDICVYSGLCTSALFILSSIITWILLFYLGSLVGRIVEKIIPEERDLSSPHYFKWSNVGG